MCSSFSHHSPSLNHRNTITLPLFRPHDIFRNLFFPCIGVCHCNALSIDTRCRRRRAGSVRAWRVPTAVARSPQPRAAPGAVACRARRPAAHCAQSCEYTAFAGEITRRTRQDIPRTQNARRKRNEIERITGATYTQLPHAVAATAAAATAAAVVVAVTRRSVRRNDHTMCTHCSALICQCSSIIATRSSRSLRRCGDAIGRRGRWRMRWLAMASRDVDRRARTLARSLTLHFVCLCT